MKENLGLQDGFLEVSLSQIDTSYGQLRLIYPQADASMVESVRQYGQLSAVVVGRGQGDRDRYELVDGFKRFRACQQLGIKSLKARVLDAGVHVLKAAMVCLNWKARSIADLEEAMVVHSLGHEDGLSQVEIAALLGRHKSWVCRRMSLVERLSDEVLSQIKLGLVKSSIGRELARLPRGNQTAALSTILKYRLTCRETARLVCLLLEHPRWDHESILRFPEQILTDRTPDRPKNSGLSRSGLLVHGKLMAIERHCLSISNELNTTDLTLFTREDWRPIFYLVEKIEKNIDHLKKICAEHGEAFP
jgi:ParB/RepB/Spo0J family partition protein